MELKQRIKLVISATLACTLAATLVSLLLPNIYEAEALLLFSSLTSGTQIKPVDLSFNIYQRTESPSANASGVSSFVNTQTYPIQTFVTLAKSHDILEEIINRLDLRKNKISIQELLRRFLKTELTENYRSYSTVEYAPVVRLRVRSKSPVLARDIANIWATILEKKSKDIYSLRFDNIYRSVLEELESSRENLKKSDEQIKNFYKESSLGLLELELRQKKDVTLNGKTRQEMAELQNLIREKQCRLNELELEKERYNTAYGLALKKLEQLKLTKEEQIPDIRIIADASLPDKHIFPRRGLIILVSFLIAFVSSTTITFLLDRKGRIKI